MIHHAPFPILRRAGLVAVVVATLAGGLAVAPFGETLAQANPLTILYASPSGFDSTGASGCTTTPDRCTLQGALNAAGALSSGPVAVYLESDVTSNAYVGELNSLYTFADPGLAVTIEPDPGLSAGTPSVFNARSLPDTSIFTVSGSGTLTFNNVLMENGDSHASGGAINIGANMTVNVTGSQFLNNQTISNSNGGAIEVTSGATLTVTNSSFTDNFAVGVGGAIDGGLGGGSTITVTNSTFTGNHGEYGGAIGNGTLFGAGTLTVTGSTFVDNSATDGGAIDNGDIAGSGTTRVGLSTFVGNTAADGGAIDNGDGGGTGTVSLTRSTVDNAGGSVSALNNAAGTFAVAGSIVAGSGGTLCTGTIVDDGYNMESDSARTCHFGAVTDALPGSSPGLATLASNGGPTQTEESSAAAPAHTIPAVPSTIVSVNAVPVTLCTVSDVDQTGTAQLTPNRCTMGALDATYQATQTTPVVLAPSTSASATQTFALTAAGGSGSAEYAFSTSTSGCHISGTTLSFTGTSLPLACSVTVVNEANSGYLASSPSLAQLFVFVAGPVTSPLIVTSVLGTFATPLTLTTSGGTGGATTYVVSNGTASGCAVSTTLPYTLTSTSPGTCLVVATTAANGPYPSSTSSLTTVTLSTTLTSTLVVTSRHGKFSTPLVLNASGGTGTGATTYRVVNGSARGCAVSEVTPFVLRTTSAGTCVVVATKAASGSVAATTSALTVVVIAPVGPTTPTLRLVARGSTSATFVVTVKSFGGLTETALQYSLNGGRWTSAKLERAGRLVVGGLGHASKNSVRVRVFTSSRHSAPSARVRFTTR